MPSTLVSAALARSLGVLPAILSLLCWGMYLPAPAGADMVSPGEYELKAALIFKLAQFVDWPAEGQFRTPDIVTVGILGQDPFGDLFEKTIGPRTVAGKRFEVKRSRRLEDLQECRILFISSSEQGLMPEILTALRNSSALTVGDMDRFAERGGMIGLPRVGNRIGFEINLTAARRARLQVSSRLLQLARVVGDDPEGKGYRAPLP